MKQLLRYGKSQGAWVAQSVKLQTLDFGSGRDLIVHGIQPRVQLCTGSVEPACDFSLSLHHAVFLSLSQIYKLTLK